MTGIYQKVELLAGLLAGDRARTGPYYANVEATRRCNLWCPRCPTRETGSKPGNGTEDLPFDTFDKLSKDLKDMGADLIVFAGGGEPLLNERIFDMVRAAKARALKTILITNGVLLDEARIRSIVESRLDVLKVSLWAATPEDYEMNYPGSEQGSFDRIVESLKLIKRIKRENASGVPSVELHQPITRGNFDKIRSLTELAGITGCDGVSFAPLYTHRGEFDEFALRPDEVTGLIASLKALKKDLNGLAMKHNIDDIVMNYTLGSDGWKERPCYVGWYHTYINSNGVVSACFRCDLPMGDLNRNTFGEIWNSAAYRDFRNKTITRKGLESLGAHTDCSGCCHAWDNLRVHRLFRWFSPFRFKEKSA